MTAPNRPTPKARSPKQIAAGELITIRLRPAQLAAIDRWIEKRPEPLTRQKAIREILSEMPNTDLQRAFKQLEDGEPAVLAALWSNLPSSDEADRKDPAAASRLLRAVCGAALVGALRSETNEVEPD